MGDGKVRVLCVVPKSQREMKVKPQTWDEIVRRFEVSANETERNWSSEELAERISDYDAVLTAWGSPPFTEQVWQNADRLKLIIHMAGSVKFLFPGDTVQRFCVPRNVTVVSCAQALAVNVAEMTIALMVMVARRIYEHIQVFRERGVWKDKNLPTNFPTINGSTVGIIGASRVGREVIRLLKERPSAVYRLNLGSESKFRSLRGSSVRTARGIVGSNSTQSTLTTFGCRSAA